MNNLFRTLIIILLVISMTGFGICGAAGLVIGSSATEGVASFFNIATIMGLLGLAIAAICVFLIRVIIKSGKPPKGEQ